MLVGQFGNEVTSIPKEELRWMPFEEYQAQQKWLHEAEQRMLRKMGLGWLVDFCSTPIKPIEDVSVRR